VNRITSTSITMTLAAWVLAGTAFANTPFIADTKRFKPYGEKEVSQLGKGPAAWTHTMERGSTPDLRYSIDYSTGLATMGIFSIECGVDAIDRYRWCRASNSHLSFYEDSRKRFHVTIGRDHFPRSRVYVRLDHEKPVSTAEPGWSGPAGRKLAARMASAKEIHTRFWEWPYRADVDESRRRHDVDIRFVLDYLSFAVSP